MSKVIITIRTTKSLPLEYFSPLEIEEAGRTKFVTGTLITSGISRNGFYYDSDNLQEIADSVVGVPIYYGTTTKVNPNTGQLASNMHKNFGEAVGKIVSAIVQGAKIKFRAEIFESFASKVRRGWGVSIGAKALGQHLIDAVGRVITKLFNIEVNHVQLLAPDCQRGVEDAQVENVEESLWFEQPRFSDEELASIIVTLNEQGVL